MYSHLKIKIIVHCGRKKKLWKKNLIIKILYKENFADPSEIVCQKNFVERYDKDTYTHTQREWGYIGF